MTFVVGFRCSNGVALCTDSLEADGVTKRHVNKTKIIGTGEWGVAIAGAGPGGFIDKFTTDVSANLERGKYDRKKIEATIEDSLSRFRSQYQEAFRILVGVQSTSAADYALYRSDDNYLSPIKDHAHIGMGHSLWRFFAENLYASGNSVADNSRLAIFIMRQAAKYVDGVEEPIQLVSYTLGDDRWKTFAGIFFLTLEKSNEGWRHPEIVSEIRRAWENSIPPTMSEQLKKFGSVKIPEDELIFLDGVAVEKLHTVSGRNKAADSFWCNKDRLRKRAMLELERDQAKK